MGRCKSKKVGYTTALLGVLIIVQVLMVCMNKLNYVGVSDLKLGDLGQAWHRGRMLQQFYMQSNSAGTDEPDTVVAKIAQCVKSRGSSDCLKQAATWLQDHQSHASNTSELAQKVGSVEQRLIQSTTFFPLKDTRASGLTDANNTWFMSSLYRKSRYDSPEEFEFPSNSSHGRILCLQGSHTTDGTKNSYAFAWRDYLPHNAVFVPGLTFVVDNYWDYVNPWHGLTALISLVDWRLRNNFSVPDHLILYHWGEIYGHIGDWVSKVVLAAFGQELKPDLMQYDDKPACFEHAVVHRRGLGSVSIPKMNKIFDFVRCESYKLCNLEVGQRNTRDGFNITILARSRTRAFKNVSALASVVQDQCHKIQGCNLQVVHVANLTFCQQVNLMRHTDILLSVHGAQVTNMIFMQRGGSILEMFPKGWLEYAGVGQYVFTWLSSWVGLQHEGTWNDHEGADCPNPNDGAKCFDFYKDSNVGLNATHLSKWMEDVLIRFQNRTMLINDIRKATHSCERSIDIS